MLALAIEAARAWGVAHSISHCEKGRPRICKCACVCVMLELWARMRLTTRPHFVLVALLVCPSHPAFAASFGVQVLLPDPLPPKKKKGSGIVPSLGLARRVLKSTIDRHDEVSIATTRLQQRWYSAMRSLFYSVCR